MALPLIVVDRFPLVRIIYPDVMTFDEIDRFLSDLEPVYARGRLAILADIGNIAQGPAQQRRHLAAGIDRLTTRHPGICVAEAAVAASMATRGLFTAYVWIKRDKSYPSRVFAQMADATRWVEGELTAAGLSLPPFELATD